MSNSAVNKQTIRLPGGREIPPGHEFVRGNGALPAADFDRFLEKGVLVDRDVRPVEPERTQGAGGDLAKLLDQNAHDVIKELPNIDDETLMELQGAESQGKNRSTVIDAISEEFDRRQPE